MNESWEFGSLGKHSAVFESTSNIDENPPERDFGKPGHDEALLFQQPGSASHSISDFRFEI